MNGGNQREHTNADKGHSHGGEHQLHQGDQGHHHNHEVKIFIIFIDKHTYHSPNPTTGAALYVLGKVLDGLELFREVTGDREDVPVPNGPEVIHLTEDEHFHSGRPKVYTIIVNGRKKETETNPLSFDQVIALTYAPDPVPAGPKVEFTVTYRKGPSKNREGMLTEGENVRIKDRMIFDVKETNKS